MDSVVRPATIEDADAIGLIHVRAWQAAYRGVMPDDYLDALSADDRAAMWRRSLEEPRPDRALRVVTVGDQVAGFTALGPEAGEQSRPAVGELYAINLEPRWWGRGLGRALLRDVTQRLSEAGHESAVLWVATANDRARTLYASEGWTYDGTARDAEVLGVTVAEVRYARLLTAAPVEIEAVDPADPRAQHCLREYVAELDRRFDTGYDVGQALPLELDEMRPPGGAFVVATLRGEPVGCGALKVRPGAPTEVKRMWVAPEARGIGLGRRLLVDLERRAAAAGSRVLRLETNRALEEAIALYRSSGYREVDAFNDEPYGDHWFEKHLDRG